MTVQCPACGTTYEGRDGPDGVEGYDPARNRWVSYCPTCSAPNLEWAEDEGDEVQVDLGGDDG